MEMTTMKNKLAWVVTKMLRVTMMKRRVMLAMTTLKSRRSDQKQQPELKTVIFLKFEYISSFKAYLFLTANKHMSAGDG